MAPTRYFRNPSEDYKGQEIDISFVKSATEELMKEIGHNVKRIEQNGSDGLYLGTAGIAYMFYHLSRNPVFAVEKSQFLQKAIEYLEPALSISKKARKADTVSFVLGNSGIYAVAAAIYSAIGDTKQSFFFQQMFLDIGKVCKDLSLSCGSEEFFVGRTGYIFGVLFLAKETKLELPIEEIYVLCNKIVKSGLAYSHRHQSKSPLMYSYYDVEYLGAAHGLCTILQVLLQVPGYLDSNPANAAPIRNSIDYLLSLQDTEGNFPAATDDIGGSNKLVHWCHGAGGMIYLMAKAYQIWQDKKYLASCEKMGELIWRKGLLKKGPGICHGVAGNGYVFLLLYRLTERKEFLYRAVHFAKFMQSDLFTNEARTPDYPYSLYEGTAGTCCFLADILFPKHATFPFSDIN